MKATPSIFLSASVPIEGRLGSEDYDPFLIREAVSALIEVILGRYHLVWGGQPAITPMIWEAAKRYDVSYPDVVTLYQSAYFKNNYPKENIKFGNFVETEAVPGDRSASLEIMRRHMLTRHNFVGAVFIGGMEGIAEEYALFREKNPNAFTLPIPSPGGYSRHLFEQSPWLRPELATAVDFTFWFYELLDVDMSIIRQRKLER